MATTEITMPQLGESITEGTVARWLKEAGESIQKYEPLLEITTDKIDTEFPSPIGGILQEIRVNEGETVAVGTLLGYISTGQSVSEAAVSPVPEPSRPASPAVSQTVTSHPQISSSRMVKNVRLSPVVARMVAEHQLDITQIVGTGKEGRIRKKDVLLFLESQDKQPDVQPAPVLSPLAEPVQDVVPLTAMRRSIAQHMVQSVQTAPHVTTVFEADMSRVMADRAAQKAAFATKGVSLTPTVYLFMAVAHALQDVPQMNNRYTDGGIITQQNIHLGMAVALEQGLVVPVIQNADELSLLGMARAMNDLAERARQGKLQPSETQGGTFTITNHGVSGSLFGTPIINQPQGGILGLGAIVKRPVVITQDGLDAIAIRPMCYLSLTFDHRLIDGRVADFFLAAVRERIEKRT